MKMIADTINLSDYVKPPTFKAKVRRASDFCQDVQNELDPVAQERDRAPSMLSRKARDLQFRSGEITCWSGYNGHRKSTFTSQAALDLCVQRQKCLIVSLEMSPARTMARMTRQATGKAVPGGAMVKQFHDWTDDRLWLFDHVGRLSTETTMGLCRYFAHELQGQHVFIDSMMKVCESEEHLDEQKQFVTSICELADETGLHIHLVTHCRKPNSGDETKAPTKYDIKGTGAISDQAHNVVMVWSNKVKKNKLEINALDMSCMNEPDAVISCEKQRNGAWEGRLQYWFDEGSMRFCDDRLSPVHPYQLVSA